MPYSSPFKIVIPQVDLLSYLFPPDRDEDDMPLWISASDPLNALSPKQALQWIRRFAFGLEKLQLQVGDVILMISPNHVYVPIAYLGSIGYGAIFSGLSPDASAKGI